MEKLPFGFSDDKIHVVYAGTLDPIKGGAFTAIEAARFLDEKYVLEILGAGSKEDILAVEEAIKKVSETTNCQVQYVGCKYGEDFNSYLQACHIGLSTQQAEAKFNATSFPSKVLTYMANGLQVVSVRIPAVETSLVGEFLYYYDRQDAKVIADVIRSVSLNDGYDSRELLNQLDEKFLKDLKTLL
jgi:glycosyltransferase involved in cell wall biosynthesis